MLASTFPQIGEEHIVFPMLFYAFAYKTALHYTVQKRIIFFPHNLSRWIISDLFWATVEGGNRKPKVREYLPQLIWQLLSHHAGCLCSYYIFVILINVYKADKYYINKNTYNTVTHCRTVLLSMLNKLGVQSHSKDGHEARKSWHLLRDSVTNRKLEVCRGHISRASAKKECAEYESASDSGLKGYCSPKKQSMKCGTGSFSGFYLAGVDVKRQGRGARSRVWLCGERTLLRLWTKATNY